MINQLLTKIQRMPQLLLGFIVIVIVLVTLTYQSPATTICDIQMAEVNQRLQKGFYSDDKRGNFQMGVGKAFEFCLQSNSAGGCYDMFTRLDYLEGLVKTVPTECGGHPSTDKIGKVLKKALRLFAMIAWGESPPINRYNRTAWLDTSDLGLYCRIKRQYQRLYSRDEWRAFIGAYAVTLPEASTLSKKELKEKSLFTYPCKSLY